MTRWSILTDAFLDYYYSPVTLGAFTKMWQRDKYAVECGIPSIFD